MMRIFASFVVGIVICLVPAQGRADDAAKQYPSRIVRMVVPFPAGGPTDTYARVVADGLHKAWGQPVIVENVVGATGIVGTKAVARAQPDGHTLLFTSNSAHVVNPLLRDPRPFDGLKEFSPIGILIDYAFLLVVNNELPVQTVGELVAYAKANPGKLNFATFGAGSGTHLVAEMFKAQAGIDVVHVAFRGISDMQVATMRGDAQFMFDSIGSAKALVDANKLRPLAVSGRQRSTAVPTVPTLDELDFKGFDARIWLGLLAPAGTPESIIQKVQQTVVNLLQAPEMRAQVATGGAEIIGSTSEGMTDYIRRETPMWAKVIESNRLTNR